MCPELKPLRTHLDSFEVSSSWNLQVLMSCANCLQTLHSSSRGAVTVAVAITHVKSRLSQLDIRLRLGYVDSSKPCYLTDKNSQINSLGNCSRYYGHGVGEKPEDV